MDGLNKCIKYRIKYILGCLKVLTIILNKIKNYRKNYLGMNNVKRKK